MFGPTEVLQTVQAQAPQRSACWHGLPHQYSCRFGNDNLTAVRHRGNPSGAMDLQAHRAGGGLGGFPCVHAHPHPELLALGQGRAAKAPCISITAARAADGEEKAAKKLSPCVPTSLPPWAASADRTSSWCSASNRVYASGPSRSSSFVEPSMSVNRKVSVSVGKL